MNCPHCQRLLYSRRHKACGFCGKTLPSEFLFTAAEAAKVKKAQEAIEQRRVLAKAKEEEERKQQAGDDGGGYF